MCPSGFRVCLDTALLESAGSPGHNVSVQNICISDSCSTVLARYAKRTVTAPNCRAGTSKSHSTTSFQPGSFSAVQRPSEGYLPCPPVMRRRQSSCSLYSLRSQIMSLPRSVGVELIYLCAVCVRSVLKCILKGMLSQLVMEHNPWCVCFIYMKSHTSEVGLHMKKISKGMLFQGYNRKIIFKTYVFFLTYKTWVTLACLRENSLWMFPK